MYFADHKDLLGYIDSFWNLREDEYKLSDDMFYERVDMLETTNDCVRFYTGTECVLALYSNPKR